MKSRKPATIRLECECGTAIDYLVSRYNLYLVPMCRNKHCARHSRPLKPTMSDLVLDRRVCYKTFRRANAH